MDKYPRSFVVLSAPSGAGKTTIARKLVARDANLKISVSATTRPRRPMETDGVDYYFLSEAEFRRNLAAGNFVEHEDVHGYHYGTLRSVLEEMIQDGKRPIFDIDVKGALSIKRLYPESKLIFIKPPSLEELKRRLQKRHSESAQAIAKRLQRINYEYKQAEKFEHIVINDDLDRAVQEIESIISRKE